MKRLGTLLLTSVILTLLVACGSEQKVNNPSSSAETIFVVTTIFPLADLVEQIGGSRVEAVALVSGGSSPHSYEPTTRDVKRVAEGDLLIQVGQGLDQFAAKLFPNNPEKLLVITDDLELLAPPETLLEDEDHALKDADHQHTHGAYDPHVWLDPILVRDQIAPRITAALKKIDQQGSDYYEANLLRFQAELTALDQEIRQAADSFKNHKFLVFHSAWHYFAQRYGLEDINVEEFPNQEPSAKDLRQVIELAKETAAAAIFVEPQFSPRAAEVIAAEFGAEVLTLDPLGGPGFTDRDSYLELMRWNLSSLEQALK